MFKRPLAILAVVTGLLIAAAPAAAQKPQPPKSICAFPDVCILYNGHAGLGAN